MQAIYQQIKSAQETLSALRKQLVEAEATKADSLDDPSLSSRHSLDRARVDMLNAAIVRAELHCKREELLLALHESDMDATAAQREYFREQDRYLSRLA